MSWELSSEVTTFIQATDGFDMTGSEIAVLYALAEKASYAGKYPRMAWDSEEWKLSRAAGTRYLRDVLQRLARRGLDVRVARGFDSRGNPMYAHKGQQCTYRLPDLVATYAKCKGAVLAAPTGAEDRKGAVVAAEGEVLTAPNGDVTAPNGVLTAPLPSFDVLPRPASSPTPQHEPTTGQEEGLRQAKALTEGRSGISNVERARLTGLVNARLASGWTTDAIRAELDKPLAGALSVYAVLHARLRDMGQPPAAPPQPPDGSMPWDQAKRQPPCKHGNLGGTTINPNGGKPWCPSCRIAA